MHPAADQVKTPTLENIDDPKSGVFRTANESLTKRAYQKSGTGGMTLLVRLVTVRSKRRGKLFDRLASSLKEWLRVYLLVLQRQNS